MPVVKIQLAFAESQDPLQELLGGRLALTEVIEGRQEFLDELDRRLQAITLPRRMADLDGDSTLPLHFHRDPDQGGAK